MPSVCHVVATSDDGKKSEMEVSADWCVAIEHQRLSSIRGDARSFSGKTPITLSRGFSIETLTGVTLSWKTKLNRNISAVEDGIPRWLQHCHKMCYKKGGHCGRWACMF